MNLTEFCSIHLFRLHKNWGFWGSKTRKEGIFCIKNQPRFKKIEKSVKTALKTRSKRATNRKVFEKDVQLYTFCSHICIIIAL